MHRLHVTYLVLLLNHRENCIALLFPLVVDLLEMVPNAVSIAREDLTQHRQPRKKSPLERQRRVSISHATPSHHHKVERPKVQPCVVRDHRYTI